jgi:hypothetical protein
VTQDADTGWREAKRVKTSTSASVLIQIRTEAPAVDARYVGLVQAGSVLDL